MSTNPAHPVTNPPRPARALATLVTVVALGGCSAADAQINTGPRPVECFAGSSLTIITPVHEGSPAPHIPAELSCVLGEALNEGAPVNVVTSEGAPQVILRGYRPDISDIEGPPHDDDLIAAQNTVIAAARSATATSDGNDLHAALSLAADLAAANGPGGVIISLDSGLTDSGVIRFTEPGMTTASPTEIATFVSATASCPHLTDTALVFYGLGYGVAPQQILTVQQRDTISGTWVEVAGTCGATVTATTLIPTTAGPVTPHTTIPVAPDTPPRFTIVPGATITLDGSVLLFEPDSDALVDPTTAAEVLDATAELLKGDPGRHVTITGTTCNLPTTWPSLEELGRARAEAVATQLLARGVTPSQITTLGAGYTANPPVTDPATAARNRTVILSLS